MLRVECRLKRGGFALAVHADFETGVTGLIGPSGSGKSTLLAVIAGLLRPKLGRVVLQDDVLLDTASGIVVPPYRRHIGLVFQDGQLFPHLSVEGNLRYGLRLRRPEGRRLDFDSVVDLLELGRLLKRRILGLSGGEKQRVALGRALLASPRLLLLDEPLASLDGGLKRQILPFLKRVKDEIQLPMIYVSHALEEVLYLTRRFVFLDQGRVLGQGDFLEAVQEEAVLNLAKSLGLESVLPVQVVRHEPELGYTVARYDHQELYLPMAPVAQGKTAFVSVSSAQVALAVRPVVGTSIQNQLPGTVTDVTRVANRALVQVDIGHPLLAEVTLKAVQDLALERGSRVVCLVKANAFNWVDVY